VVATHMVVCCGSRCEGEKGLLEPTLSVALPSPSSGPTRALHSETPMRRPVLLPATVLVASRYTESGHSGCGHQGVEARGVGLAGASRQLSSCCCSGRQPWDPKSRTRPGTSSSFHGQSSSWQVREALGRDPGSPSPEAGDQNDAHVHAVTLPGISRGSLAWTGLCLRKVDPCRRSQAEGPVATCLKGHPLRPASCQQRQLVPSCVTF